MVIIAWDLLYFVKSLNFSWGSDTAAYFVQNVGGSDNLSNIGNFFIPVGIGVVVSWIILWFISHRSIDKGIGLASKILIPAVFIIMIIIVVNVVIIISLISHYVFLSLHLHQMIYFHFLLL